MIDQCLLLFGPVRTVYAELDRRRPAAEVDDDVFVALTHVSGVRSHLWASVVAAAPAPRLRALGRLGAYRQDELDTQEALLADGVRPPDPAWAAALSRPSGILTTDGTTERIPSEPGDWPAFYRAVRDALRTGAPMPVDPADAVAVLEVIEAARRSAAIGGVAYQMSVTS